jgi:hypothetical protein
MVFVKNMVVPPPSTCDGVPRHRTRFLVCGPWSLGIGLGTGLSGIGLSLWLLGPWIGLAQAHPPVRHQSVNGGPERSSDIIGIRRERPPTDDERRDAHEWYEFFSDFARRCPTVFQAEVIRQSIAEHRLAAGSPEASSFPQLIGSREDLLARLRATVTWLAAEWHDDGIHWKQAPVAITVVDGDRRIIVVEVLNTTVTGFTLTGPPAVDGQVVRTAALPPRVARPFIVEISAKNPPEVLTFTTATVARSLSCEVATIPAATLRLTLVDGGNNAPTPCRVRVAAADGRLRHAGPFARNPSYAQKPILELPTAAQAAVPFFYAEGTVEMVLPPGRTAVSLERGFEHAVVTETVDLRPGETRDAMLVVHRIHDAPAEGWISGDTHIHWVTNAWNVDLPLADLALVQRAEDLHVVNNLTLLHRTATDAFVKPSQGPVGPVAALSDADYHIEMAEEYRNQNLYGHLCFLDLRWLVLPIGTGPQIAGDDSLDFPINRTAILEARGQGAVAIEAHGTGANHELPLHAVHGLVDSIDQLDAEDYYRLLDCGFQLPLTNGSDHPARVAGCARAYVKIDGPFDYEKWIDGIRLGRTFTTSGPLLFLEVDGQGPGSVLLRDGGHPCTARLHAVSRHPLGRVQIVSNGQILAETVTDDRETTLECPLPSDGSRWVVARCSSNDQWNAIWHADVAHTAAVYVHRDGLPVFKEEAAAGWVARMRLHARDILAKGRFADAAQRQAAVGYVAEAIRRYERIIDGMKRGWNDFDLQRDRLLMQAGFVSHRGHDPQLTERVVGADSADGLAEAVRPLTLLRVHVNPESRVKLWLVTPPETLVQHRTTRFLVEIHNEARIQAPLRIRAWDRTNLPSREASWCAVRIVDNVLSSSMLSGAEREWKLFDVRCSEAGHREVLLEADAGQGTQDLGFRAAVDLLLECVPRSSGVATLPPMEP